MSPAERDAILARVGAWLDAWPDDEPLPAGLDPAVVDDEEASPDLVTLASAVAAAARQMEIQGKAFKRLQEEVAGLSRLPPAPESATPALDDMLELHDRLARCAQQGKSATEQLSWLARRAGAATIFETQLEGLELILARCTDVLDRLGVQPIEPNGQPFDPTQMRAVDRVATREVPDGSVFATLRRGYRREHHVLRPADVRVARSPDGTEA